MSSEYGGLDFTIKTRKDKYYDELKQLAKKIDVNDVQLIVSDKPKSNFNAFDLREELAFQNKYDLAKKIPDIKEDEIGGEIGPRETRKIMKHINDFKAKGRLENYMLRQTLRRWKNTALDMTRKKEMGEYGSKANDLYKINYQRDDLTIQIKKNFKQQKDFILKADEGVAYRGTKGIMLKEKDHIKTEIQKSNQVPGPELRKFIPYCNDIISINVQKKGDENH